MNHDDAEDDSFYEQVSLLILEWLDEGDRLMLREEFRTNEANFDRLPSRNKLLALLRYVDVNYVSGHERILLIDRHVEKLNSFISPDPEDASIRELHISDIAGDMVEFSSLRVGAKKANREQIAKLFDELLQETGLQEVYKVQFKEE